MRRTPPGAVGAAALLAALVLAVPASAGTVRRTLAHGGLTREYRLHVPPSYSKGRPVALVLVFHGGGGTARQMERYTGWSALATREGFIVAYPESVEGNWNDGRGVATLRSHRENVDDVGFVAAIINTLSREYALDPGRIFATGISNGAFVSHLLGARLSRRIAAIAPVVGGMAPAVAGKFHPERPVSVLIIQGTEDPLVPYKGGRVAWNRGETIGTEEAVKKWVDHDGARGPRTEDVPDTVEDDGCVGKRVSYTDGRDGTAVVLYALKGGGHAWPGAAQYLPEGIIGRVCRDFDATRLIWEFFSAHPRP